MVKLYTDCKTDTERASFFKSGRGWESGIVAKSLEGDLADVFAFRAAVAKLGLEEAIGESEMTEQQLQEEIEQRTDICAHCGKPLSDDWRQGWGGQSRHE